MIDNHVFSAGLTLLCTHYNRELQPEVLRIWKEYLDAVLTTEQFQQAIKLTLLESRFFPTAKDLVEAVTGGSDTLALSDWELCVKAAARADREMLSALSVQGQNALHLVGGLHKLGMATEDQLVWIKKEFVGLWKSTKADVKALPQSRNPAVPQLDAV